MLALIWRPEEEEQGGARFGGEGWAEELALMKEM